MFQLASLTDVHWTMSGEVVLMTLLGGMGTIFGPVVGAFVIIGLENYLAPLRAMGHDDHRRHLRRLRARIPARHRRRARRIGGTAAPLKRSSPQLLVTLCLLAVALAGPGEAGAQRLAVQGACRDGVPHGAYELRRREGSAARARRVQSRQAHRLVHLTGRAAVCGSRTCRTTRTRATARSRCGIATPTRASMPQHKLEAVYAAGPAQRRSSGLGPGWTRARRVPLRRRRARRRAGMGRASPRASRSAGAHAGRAGRRAFTRHTSRRWRRSSHSMRGTARQPRPNRTSACQRSRSADGAPGRGPAASNAVPLTRCGKPRKMTARPPSSGRPRIP